MRAFFGTIQCALVCLIFAYDSAFHFLPVNAHSFWIYKNIYRVYVQTENIIWLLLQLRAFLFNSENKKHSQIDLHSSSFIHFSLCLFVCLSQLVDIFFAQRQAESPKKMISVQKLNGKMRLKHPAKNDDEKEKKKQKIRQQKRSARAIVRAYTAYI